MKLFPYTMLRISGGAFSVLLDLEVFQLNRSVSQYLQTGRQLKLLRESIAQGLYHSISHQSDNLVQNRLLNFRRAIFKGKPIDHKRIVQISPFMDQDLNDAIKDYLALLEVQSEISRNGASLYTASMITSRKKLRALAQDDLLRSGLLFSSRSFLDRLSQWLDRDPNSVIRKKDRKTEFALLKYITRMHTKTSPFSTFTQLSLAEVDPVANVLAPPFRMKSDATNQVKSSIRLNNQLFGYLKNLLVKHDRIRMHLCLRLNPTVVRESEGLHFLSMRNNVEAFQELKASPIALEIITWFKEKGGMNTMAELVDHLVAIGQGKWSRKGIVDDLDSMLNSGFLDFDLQVSALDPGWDIRLVEQLTAHCAEIPVAKELCQNLNLLRTQAKAFTHAEFQERQHILEEAYGGFRKTCMKLHEAADLPALERSIPVDHWRMIMENVRNRIRQQDQEPVKEEEPPSATYKEPTSLHQHREGTYFDFQQKDLFYEDTTRELKLDPLSHPLKELLFPLDQLYRLIGPVTPFEKEQKQQSGFFSAHFSDQERVGLLDFYEAYAQKVLKTRIQEDQLRGPTSSGPHKLPDGLLAEKDPDGNIQLRFKNEASMEEGTGYAGPGYSTGVFLQLIPETGSAGNPKLRGVINVEVSGHGKWFSRFLHLFPEAVTENLRTRNLELCEEGELFLEINDAVLSNANLHPPLLPFELRMPGGYQQLPSEQQIPIQEIEIEMDKEHQCLVLRHSVSGKRIWIFDLGFTGGEGRAEMFKFLSGFMKPPFFSTRRLVHTLNEWTARNERTASPPELKNINESIRVLPRITLEDRLVIQRKTWVIPKSMLPLKKVTDSDWSYFLRINEWKEANGLPDYVFIRLSNSEEIKRLKWKANGPGRDDYKPQYISFRNPLTVSLFSRLLPKVITHLRITEMLPGSGEQLEISGASFATEFLVQWDRMGGTP